MMAGVLESAGHRDRSDHFFMAEGKKGALWRS